MSNLLVLIFSFICLAKVTTFPSIIDTNYPHIIRAEGEELYLYLPSGLSVDHVRFCHKDLYYC